MNKMLLSAVVLSSVSLSCVADDFNINVLSVMATNQSKADPILGTGTSNKDLTTYQFEHFSSFKYGDIYLDAELYEGDDVGGQGAGSFGSSTDSQSLLVANPRLSLSKMTGKSFAVGPISDASLIARWERASYGDFRSRNYGVSLNFNVPGFAYFESGLLQREHQLQQCNLALALRPDIKTMGDGWAAIQFHLALLDQWHRSQRDRVFHSARSAMARGQGRGLSIGCPCRDSQL